MNGWVEEINDYAKRAMEQGVIDEPKARALFMKYTGFSTIEVGIWMKDGLGASPDGVVWLPRVKSFALLEIKRPFMYMYETPKVAHIVQMYVQMYCTGLKYTFYCAYFPDIGMRMWLFKFHADVWEWIKQRIDYFFDNIGPDGYTGKSRGPYGAKQSSERLFELLEQCDCIERITKEKHDINESGGTN